MFQWPFDHWFYRAATWANLISFAIFRFGSISVIYYGMIYMRHRVSPAYFTLLAMSIFVMSTINVILFWRLFKNDVLRPLLIKSSSTSSSSAAKGVDASTKESDSPMNISSQRRTVIANGDMNMATRSNGGAQSVHTNGGVLRNGVIAHAHND